MSYGTFKTWEQEQKVKEVRFKNLRFFFPTSLLLFKRATEQREKDHVQTAAWDAGCPTIDTTKYFSVLWRVFYGGMFDLLGVSALN